MVKYSSAYNTGAFNKEVLNHPNLLMGPNYSTQEPTIYSNSESSSLNNLVSKERSLNTDKPTGISQTDNNDASIEDDPIITKGYNFIGAEDLIYYGEDKGISNQSERTDLILSPKEFLNLLNKELYESKISLVKPRVDENKLIAHEDSDHPEEDNFLTEFDNRVLLNELVTGVNRSLSHPLAEVVYCFNIAERNINNSEDHDIDSGYEADISDNDYQAEILNSGLDSRYEGVLDSDIDSGYEADISDNDYQAGVFDTSFSSSSALSSDEIDSLFSHNSEQLLDTPTEEPESSLEDENNDIESDFVYVTISIDSHVPQAKDFNDWYSRMNVFATSTSYLNKFLSSGLTFKSPYFESELFSLPYMFYNKTSRIIQINLDIRLSYFKFIRAVEDKLSTAIALSYYVNKIDQAILNGHIISDTSTRVIRKLETFSKSLTMIEEGSKEGLRQSEFIIINKLHGLNRETSELRVATQNTLKKILLAFSCFNNKKIELRANSDQLMWDSESLEPSFLNFKKKFFLKDYELFPPLGEEALTIGVQNTYSIENGIKKAKAKNFFNSLTIYKYLETRLKFKSTDTAEYAIYDITNKSKRARLFKHKYIKLISSYSKLEHETGFLSRVYSQVTRAGLPYWNAEIFVLMLTRLFSLNRFLLLRILSRALFAFRFNTLKPKEIPKSLKIEAAGLIKRLGRSSRMVYRLKHANKYNFKSAVDFEENVGLSRYGITSFKVSLEY